MQNLATKNLPIATAYRTIVQQPDLNSSALAEELSALEPRATRQPIPITWSSAQGFSVFDELGNRYIDMTSGIFVANSGHSNPKIKRAMKRQIDENLIFSYNYPTQIRKKFLEKLLAISPNNCDCAALLMTGSEAIDLAYKLIKLWGAKNNRKYIVTFRGSYHGRGLSNELIGGSPEKAAWSGVTDPNVIFLDFPYKPTDTPDFSKLPPANQIAAFMLETFQGWGAWFYPPGYVNSIYAFAKDNGALMCFDEMQAGFYRLGPVYGYMTYGDEIRADLICVGKGLSGSLPVAAVITRKEITDINPQSDQHGTHTGNPLCCAAALANIEFLSAPSEQRRIKKRAQVFEKEVGSLIRCKAITQVNVRGMIAALIFENAQIATRVVHDCIKDGVLVVCTNRNSIKLAPPLIIDPEAITEAVAVIESAVLRNT